MVNDKGERAYFESLALRQHGSLCPDHVPEVYHFDRPMSLIGMQYLKPPHIILRKGLIAGVEYPLLAKHMSTYMARTLFFTSLLYRSTLEHKREANLQGENGSAQSGHLVGSDERRKSYTLFQVRLWSTKLNANLVCYKGHNYPVWDVQCVQWHANCNYIATGSSDKTIRLWDVQTGECARIFIGHRSMVTSLAMSPDGRYMASRDEDGTIMMWDLSSGRCVSPLTGHNSCVWMLAFSCEGTLLASGSADCTVKLWDVTSSTKALKVDEKGSSANRLRLLKALPIKSTPVRLLKALPTLNWSTDDLLDIQGLKSKACSESRSADAIIAKFACRVRKNPRLVRSIPSIVLRRRALEHREELRHHIQDIMYRNIVMYSFHVVSHLARLLCFERENLSDL